MGRGPGSITSAETLLIKRAAARTSPARVSAPFRNALRAIPASRTCSMVHILKNKKLYNWPYSLYVEKYSHLVSKLTHTDQPINREMRGEITIRDGKGMKDRITMLPGSSVSALQEHLRRVKAIHQQDLVQGRGRVALPFALAEWVEEPVARTPPPLDPIVPYSGNRLKIKPFTRLMAQKSG